MPSRLTRAATLVAAAATLAAAGWVFVVLPARSDDAARMAAERYLGLVARADAPAEAEQLWGMNFSSSPGAVRTAGEMLLGASERITVVSIGDPRPADDDIEQSVDVELADLTSVPTRIRLGSRESDFTLTLGRIADTSGRDVSDWRVLADLLPNLDWEGAAVEGSSSDAYVSRMRVERLGQTDAPDNVQPLYPARYVVQRRADPWFASSPTEIDVLDGEGQSLPSLDLAPTARTNTRVRTQIMTALSRCADPGAVLCPVLDAAKTAGVDLLVAPQSWLGMVDLPRVRVRADHATLSGGAFRVRTPRGVRTVKFAGTARHALDRLNRPMVFQFDLVRAR